MAKSETRAITGLGLGRSTVETQLFRANLKLFTMRVINYIKSRGEKSLFIGTILVFTGLIAFLYSIGAIKD